MASRECSLIELIFKPGDRVKVSSPDSPFWGWVGTVMINAASKERVPGVGYYEVQLDAFALQDIPYFTFNGVSLELQA